MAAIQSIRRLAVLVLGLLSTSAFAQTAPNDWAWMGGGNTIPTCSQTGLCGATGVYGTPTQFAAGNLPGARQEAATWTDKSGNLWLFGGNGYDGSGTLGDLNDLWEYNPTTKQWAWMAGSSTVPSCTPAAPPTPAKCTSDAVYGTLNTPATGNIPGARYSAATWTDSSGNFWLFGGDGYDSAGNLGYLNDLWEFNPSTMKWAWMGGSNLSPNIYGENGQPGVYGTLGSPSPANVPGARIGASTWVDANGNLWLFGGTGEDALAEYNDVIPELDDLWKFTPSTGEWTWMGGSNEVYLDGNPGTYGTLGVAAATNQPGGRDSATSWTDNSGNLWLFGGGGYNGNNYLSTLNDLWEFSPETNAWTWMGGNTGSTSPAETNLGVYGTLGTFAPGNMPQGRSNATGWKDSNGDFWLFGGKVYGGGFEGEGYLNDVWEFSPSKNQWAWMGVTVATCDICTAPGVYGTLGTASPANMPGGRDENASWTDANGHLWIFGGMGDDGAGNYGNLNDLWEYQPASGAPAAITPTVMVSPSASSITTAQALAVTVSVSGGGGNPTPTGTIILTSGNYTSQVAALSGGSVVVNVPANSLESAVDTLTAYYTPDAASATTYTIANGSATENVAATSQTTPGVYLTTVAFGIWTTQSLPVTVEVSGPGYLVPTGSIVLTAGSYTSPAIPITGGKQTSGFVNFVMPAGSLPVGPGTITATYTPDAISSESLTGASGTINVLVSVEPPTLLDWTWMGGDSILPGINSQYGVYGTEGVASPDNWPGGRFAFSYWDDSNGNLWVFGGEGNDSIHHGADMNDLWEFNSTTGEWTWVSGSSSGIANGGGGYDSPASYGTLGVFAPGNVPGGRSYASQGIDGSNHLWLFGGYGFDTNNVSAYLNDLWEYDPTKNEWAWISGSSNVAGQQNGQIGVYGTLGVPAPGNVPQAREEAVSWVDKNGNFWVFGGSAQDETVFQGSVCGVFNDYWMFNPSTSEWAWMGGPNLQLQANNCTDEASPPPGGTYGTQGTFASGNIPGSRDGAVTWVDSTGMVWLFGGDGYDANDSFGYLNDLWEFNPTTNQWAWISGSNLRAQNGVYGTVGVAAAGNVPGARFYPQTWIDSNNNLWLLGGDGRDENGNSSYLNDFWEFNTTTKLWTWMGGSPALPTQFGLGWPGIYGTLGVPASGNTSGGRAIGATLVDKNGSFWLFSGYGWDSVQQDGWMNDLWKYRPALDTNTPDFTITTTTPTEQVSQAGNSATYIVTITAVNGFSGQIALSVSGNSALGVSLPASVTIPVGGSQAFNVVITSALSLGVGTFSETITGASASGPEHSLVLTLQVASPGLTPTVTVVPSPASISPTQALSVTVTVGGGSGNPTPTGSVTLTSGSYTSSAVTLSSGSATINVPAGSLAAGTDTLTASYTPDQTGAITYTPATGSNVVAVTAAATAPTVTVTPSPSSITTTQALSVTVTVSGTPTPTGSVTLTSGSYSSGAVTLSSGIATINIPAGALGKGTDTLTAGYTPDANSSSTYTSATGSNTVTVTTPALITPTVTVTPGSSSITSAQALSVGVTVSGGNGSPTPTGSVTLTSGTYNSGAVALSGGSATINVPAGLLATSTDTLTVTYTPDSNSSTTYNSATGSNTVTVTAAAFQVTVGTTPAGLSFSVDGTSYMSSQTLTWTVGTSHTIATQTPQVLAGTQESFSAWSDGGAQSHTVTASSTTTTYTATFTATAYQLTTSVSPAADGTVTPASGTFYAPGTVVSLTATANSGFSFTNWTGNVTSATGASTTVTMSAPQSVTANFGAATLTGPVASLSSLSPLVFTATVGTTSAAQTATLTNSGNVTLNITGITITGANSTDFAVSTGANACGTTLAADSSCLIYVTFTPASAAIFSATLSVADNAAGSPQTASLSGTGAPVPTFTISSTTAPQIIQRGGTAQFTITATAQNGTFSNPVTLIASGLPTGAIATFTPPSVTPGSSSANSTLSIQTGTTATAAVSGHNSSWPFATSALAVIGLCLVPGKRRRWITMALLLIASLGALTGLTACGGGFAFIAPSQSYSITVTGTSGTEVQTTTVQLTVQ
jgi:N-acetylneuraminic acid mutarotase